MKMIARWIGWMPSWNAIGLSRGWSFGIGTVNGHGQITLSVAGVDPALLARLPKGVRELPVTSAANLDWAVVLALPNAAEWEALRSWIEPAIGIGSEQAATNSDPEAEGSPSAPSAAADTAVTDAAGATDLATGSQAIGETHWTTTLDNRLRQLSGISAATLFSRIGPELAIWQDSAGRFATLRIKDPDGFDSLLAHLSAHMAGELKTRRWNGMDIHEYSVELGAATPAAGSEATTSSGEIDEASLTEVAGDGDADGSAQAPASALWSDLQHLRLRAYWVEEGPFLVAAKPQSNQ